MLLLVSSLIGDPSRVLELADKAGGGEFLYIVQPTAPWMEASSLSQAYNIYKHHNKMERILKNEDVVITSDVPTYIIQMAQTPRY